jgi:hypothetical protein
MAAPNLIAGNVIYGVSTGANLTSASTTSILSNANSSGHVYKVNTLNAANWTATAATLTVSYYTVAELGGTAYPIVSNVTVPAYSTFNVLDRGTLYYLAENTSIGAKAGTANTIVITASYEDIS